MQIFLLISGFLYGQRDNITVNSFYKRNIIKILVDYYVFLIIIIPIYIFAVHYPINISTVLGLLFGVGTSIPGLGHLWYISTILVCYIITPFIIRLLKPKINLLWIFTIFCFIEVFFILIPGFTGAWINCYIIGMIIGTEYGKEKDSENALQRVLMIALPVCIIICGAEIYIKYIGLFELSGIVNKISNTIFHYGRIALGCIVLAGSLLFAQFLKIKFSPKIQALLDISDEYSYDAYIVHLFCILGPYSFFQGRETLGDIVVGILLMLVYVFASSVILHFLSSNAKKLIKS